MSSEPNKIYSYYKTDCLNIRRVDQFDNVEIFWLSTKRWRKSIAQAFVVRNHDQKITEGEAMEVIAKHIGEIS